MESRTPGMLTVHECMQAMKTMNTFYDSSYSAPFVLVYKDKPEVRSMTSGIRSSVLHDVSKPRSVLEMRLDFQDYLMTDYLLSKRALLMSAVSVPSDDSNSSQESNPIARDELQNGTNCQETIPSNMYHENSVLKSGEITLSVKNIADDVLPKKKTRQNHLHSSSAELSSRYTHNRENKSTNSRSSAPQKSQTASGPFILRYTKR